MSKREEFLRTAAAQRDEDPDQRRGLYQFFAAVLMRLARERNQPPGDRHDEHTG